MSVQGRSRRCEQRGGATPSYSRSGAGYGEGGACCAVGLGSTVSAAQRKAYALVDAISWQGMQCRRDIGYRAIEREIRDKL